MSLTPRQLDCLRLAADGLSQPEIGAQLGISSQTVRTHIVHVLAKLGARNTTQAVALGYSTGLLGDAHDLELVALVRLAERMGQRIALVPLGDAIQRQDDDNGHPRGTGTPKPTQTLTGDPA